MKRKKEGARVAVPGEMEKALYLVSPPECSYTTWEESLELIAEDSRK